MNSFKICCYLVGREKIFYKMDCLGGIFFMFGWLRRVRKRKLENIFLC